MGSSRSRAKFVVAGLILAGVLVAAFLLQRSGHLYEQRGVVDVSYPAGEVEEVRVLDSVTLYVDGEPKPGPSVLGAIALFVLATASFMTFAALRFAGARKQLRLFWLLAAAGLAVAAADELFALHETAGHNLAWLADLPAVKRPDDALMLIYLAGAIGFAWVFRDVLRSYRPTLVCLIAAIGCFALSAASDLASVRIEEWFELAAGLFLAAALIALMHRHLTQNLHVRVQVGRPVSDRPGAAPAPASTPARDPVATAPGG